MKKYRYKNLLKIFIILFFVSGSNISLAQLIQARNDGQIRSLDEEPFYRDTNDSSDYSQDENNRNREYNNNIEQNSDENYAPTHQYKKEIKKFRNIEVRGSIRLSVSKGNKRTIEINVPPSMMNRVRVRVSKGQNNSLVIESFGSNISNEYPSKLPLISVQIPSSDTNFWLSTSQNISYKTQIFMSNLNINNFSYLGRGNSSLIINKLTAQNVSIKTFRPKEEKSTTSGDIKIKQMNVEKLKLNLVGSSNLNLAGRAKYLEVFANEHKHYPAVDISAENLIADNCIFDLAYFSTLKINSKNYLTGTLSGKATLIYQGNPKIKIKKGVNSIVRHIKSKKYSAPNTNNDDFDSSQPDDFEQNNNVDSTSNSEPQIQYNSSAQEIDITTHQEQNNASLDQENYELIQ